LDGEKLIMNLFQLQKTILNSGKESDFKIECDALTDEDIECCAYLISKKVKFWQVLGVPRGGLRLAKALEKYIDASARLTLVVDDVLTTGNSINDCVASHWDEWPVNRRESKGFVIFARCKCPDWITPLFQMTL
jgi:hypothetical protein